MFRRRERRDRGRADVPRGHGAALESRPAAAPARGRPDARPRRSGSPSRSSSPLGNRRAPRGVSGSSPTLEVRMKKLCVSSPRSVAGLAARRRRAGRLHGHRRSQLDAEGGHAAGEPWVVTIRVLQHGRTPMPDAKPEVRIRNACRQVGRLQGEADRADRLVSRPRRRSRRPAATRSASTTGSRSRSARRSTPSVPS